MKLVPRDVKMANSLDVPGAQGPDALHLLNVKEEASRGSQT
jgi:hypothetical protein